LLSFYRPPPPPALHFFPTRRSSDLQHVLIEALTRTAGVQALIVGDALFGEDAYRDRLRQQVARAGLGDRVRFTGFRRDIPALMRSEEHTSELQSRENLVCRLLLEKK